MGKFFVGLLLVFLILGGAAYYIYTTTGYKFGIDSTILSHGTINISNQEFVNNGKIPSSFTCDGENLSPTFLLQHVPSTAKSLAIILEDTDSAPKYFTHWLAFNIGPSTETIEASKVLGSATVGTNDFGNTEYDGPCPPSGVSHKYYFRVYALDTMLDLTSSATRSSFNTAINGHVITTGEIGAYYTKVAN
ncbi:MAG TPA: YbhB/YbcL family Raf kinase inhibitor-like protein [Patescibacteria group bacterium]|nr:YbhB/YbcL family Raf kinase inhibitor-like protein [Patescibacteria group bacterium]